VTAASAFRARCRTGEWTGQTSGQVPGCAQGNLVILPREEAADFLLYCQRNPKPCPLLDVTAPGDPCPARAAPDGDLRTDLPRYRVWRDGTLVEEPTTIGHLWRDDLVSFVIGCSFTFEDALIRAGVPVRHLELGRNVPMYRTSVPTVPAGRFHGPLVVSMRPMLAAEAIRAVQITSRFPAVHGVPVHLGDPGLIGIGDLSQPDFGEAVPLHAGEIPVFWACGVTPQAAVMAAKLEFCITHSPGCMLVTDLRDEELAG
jgi:uncharacterized protein YcsI (UPF0317 family)